MFGTKSVSYPADIIERLDLKLALERVQVVAGVRLVLEVERLLPDARLAVGGGEDAARALHGRRSAVAGNRAAPHDALHLVVADPGHVAVLDLGGARVVAQDPERVAEQPALACGLAKLELFIFV